MNGYNVVRLFSYNHPELDLEAEISALKTKLRDVETATRIDQLFGMEGSAAKVYFDAFGKMLPGGFAFPGRKKHPPTDPVNALLSLSYTMIFNEISSLLDGLGFDPYLAYYHSIDYGRASLASDLMEEFRSPVAGRLTLNLVNNQVFGKEDFYSNPKERMYLRREALKRYFVKYEEMLNREFVRQETGENTTFRKRSRYQTEKLAASIQIYSFSAGGMICCMSYLTISLAPFYAQGSEKVCKAYILGKSASEYEGLPEKEAREKIDKIVRDKRIGTLHLTHPA